MLAAAVSIISQNEVAFDAASSMKGWMVSSLVGDEEMEMCPTKTQEEVDTGW
jgi:hypothetical protein